MTKRLFSWARAHSLWYFSAAHGCCGEELFNTFACRYDVERFGCLPQIDPEQADLLIVGGVLTKKMAPYLREVYDLMLFPKYVMAIGSCASSGGIFSSFPNEAVIPGLDLILPVDVFVAGCPPRPEAIMHGLLKMQGKILGNTSPRHVGMLGREPNRGRP